MSRVYDLGPSPPIPPKKPEVMNRCPELPPGTDGDPALAPAIARYEAAMRGYADYLARYPAERAAFNRLHGENCAAEMDMPHVMAAEALANDPERYVTELPQGFSHGPRTGLDRIILS